MPHLRSAYSTELDVFADDVTALSSSGKIKSKSHKFSPRRRKDAAAATSKTDKQTANLSLQIDTQQRRVSDEEELDESLKAQLSPRAFAHMQQMMKERKRNKMERIFGERPGSVLLVNQQLPLSRTPASPRGHAASLSDSEEHVNVLEDEDHSLDADEDSMLSHEALHELDPDMSFEARERLAWLAMESKKAKLEKMFGARVRCCDFASINFNFHLTTARAVFVAF